MRNFIAERRRNMPESKLIPIFDNATRYDDVINLSIGDPDVPTPRAIVDAMYQDALKGHTKYTNSWGEMELREEIVKFYQEEYGVQLGVNEVFIAASGCLAMTEVMMAVLDPGDEVLLFDPYFTCYTSQIEEGLGVPVLVPSYENEDWQPNMERAAQYLTARTKAILFTSPNNPTGAFYTQKTLEQIAAFAQAHDLLVIADDIYTAFCYDAPFLPIMTLPGMRERTVTVNSFSKNFIMTGFRLGNVVAPAPIAKAIKSVGENIIYCPPSPSQRAALYALRHRKEIEATIKPEFAARVAYARARIQALPYMTVSAQGAGFYLFPGIAKTGLGSIAACNAFLDGAHVLMLPGAAFGDAGEGYMRIACTVDVETLGKAFDRLEKLKF
ncbi:MAG: aminotransferase class I/II-fold pyridoxal phosphate-dependent enzyme [Christensenellaceae bacterium]|jgi:aspartate/methionine/tyrosine aminotransferase|nr:aminotransferase class I/II-fold pyridoxal phosphate-dependent enzyme [Christensenellaceae bacterium]